MAKHLQLKIINFSYAFVAFRTEVFGVFLARIQAKRNKAKNPCDEDEEPQYEADRKIQIRPRVIVDLHSCCYVFLKNHFLTVRSN